MSPINLLDQNMQMLSKVLDLRATKAQVISSNIANAETPGFSASRFQFEDELANALGNKKGIQLQTSNKAHIPLGPGNFHNISGKIILDEEQSGIGDDNNVSVDMEMMALSENELLYETSAQLLKKKITLLKHVISGGQ
ncbi:MAG: flagellar basal-body rod protein FlgB [Desulforhopalus sp.]|jgi:flagellar basal-body rod protein FlgB